MLRSECLHLRPAILLIVAALSWPGLGWAQTAAEADWLGQAQGVAQAAAERAAQSSGEGVRVTVELGRLDPRLRLAPCQQIEPFLLPGQKLWGRSRIGLRCLKGTTLWRVSLPVTVHVFAKALVASVPLDAGTQLEANQLRLAEMDIAAESGAVFTEMASVQGRSLARPVQAGELLRSGSLKPRQWFLAGAMVKVTLAGDGFAVSSEGQALSQGLDGQDVRVRLESGRTVIGRPVGERLVEVLL